MEVDPECLELALATFPYTECSMSSGSMEVETNTALLRVLGSLCSKLYDHKSSLSENIGTDEESDDESETRMMVDSTVGVCPFIIYRYGRIPLSFIEMDKFLYRLSILTNSFIVYRYGRM